MLLSTPSSGTDWLCPIIAEAAQLNYWHKEFFNPICNYKLNAAGFGCEMISCYEHISSPQANGFTEAIQGWGETGCNFDKEVFSLAKLPIYAKHFRCALLYREPAVTFPPSRARVWVWYDAIWNSLKLHGYPVTNGPLLHRATEAHKLTWQRAFRDADMLGVPVIRYSDLLSEDPAAVRRAIDCGWIEGINVESAVLRIIATRVRK